jgi:hypothetical protein
MKRQRAGGSQDATRRSFFIDLVSCGTSGRHTAGTTVNPISNTRASKKNIFLCSLVDGRVLYGRTIRVTHGRVQEDNICDSGVLRVLSTEEVET